jgi:hypothetical protein
MERDFGYLQNVVAPMDTMHWMLDTILTKLSVTAFATMLVVLFHHLQQIYSPVVNVSISRLIKRTMPNESNAYYKEAERNSAKALDDYSLEVCDTFDGSDKKIVFADA